MNNYFIYSILQYEHSIALGESLNIGILFYFIEDNSFEFVAGDISRIKAIYSDFSTNLYQSYFKMIEKKLKKEFNLSTRIMKEESFSAFIHQHILAKDAAGLVFRKPVQVKNVFGSKQTAVNEYTKLFLPQLTITKPKLERHNENYIFKRFNSCLLSHNERIKDQLVYNKQIKTPHFNITFNLYWEKSSANYVKPISFDYSEENLIMNKAAMFYSYLSDLSNIKDSCFNFLISKPQNQSFDNIYQNALDFIHSAKGEQKLIFEDEFENFSQVIIADLA